jgi:hypothetical protein
MWLLTENPWPVMIALSVVAVGLVAAWRTRQDTRLLVVAGVAILLAAGVWELERRIVTERERLAARVLDLRDAVQAKELVRVFGFFSNSDLTLKTMAISGLAMVSFEDQIRVTALETTLTSNDTRGETRFRANVSLNVAGYGSVGRRPTLWSLTWRKEADEWRIIKIRRFHPLSHKEIPPLTQNN